MSPDILAGKYQIIQKLGEGTFGDVYLVQHTDLSTRYALKLLKSELSSDTGFVSRFKREAEILLRFHHAGSVQLRDFGRTETGLYYMATDYCEGKLLEKYLDDNGRLPVEEAIRLAIEILDIIDAAHEFGIIHRDIKPGNIVIENMPSGRKEIRILDFGIAKLRDEVRAQSHPEVELTTYGTPVYMSPEQCAGETDLDPRVDIYACGIVLYEMLTGWVPFDSQEVLQILLKHLTQPPPTFPKQFEIPLSLQEVVFKSLEKERDARFTTAKEFANALRSEHARLSPKSAVPTAPVLRPAPEMTAPTPLEHGDNRILCLDDNEMILQIMKHLLEKEGNHVFIANNFTHIHDYIFVENVPLLICDVNMPGPPGNKICQMLKKAKPDLKIILFSNIPERDLERLAKEAKADDWMSKNDAPNTWLQKIKDFNSRMATQS